VSSREERVASNESTTRQINEQIEQAHAAAPVEGHVRVLCECGREDCDRLIAMTLAEYESLRAGPRQFAVTHNHVLADVEQVVAETERGRQAGGDPGGGGGRGGPARLAARAGRLLL
jgi:hypothetical protein